MENNRQYTYRLMQPHEADIVFDLILRVFHQHVAPTYSRKGAQNFLSMLTVDYLKENEGKKFTIVAEEKDNIVGMLSNIDSGHIALFFVESNLQGRGIGKGLLKYYLELCAQRFPKLRLVTVSSSPNSLTFYEKAGFEKISEEQSENGLRYIPMQMAI